MQYGNTHHNQISFVVQTIINPGLTDRADANPGRIYRLMRPYLARQGQPTDFATVSKNCLGQTISGVFPETSPTWAPNPRYLGATSKEVIPMDPSPSQPIQPGAVGQAGAGMSVIPVMDVALLPPGRIPKRNRGRGSNVDCWFALNRYHIEALTLLRLHFDIGDGSSPSLIAHGVIEPAAPMLPDVYIRALHGTQSRWICLNH
jgi:hypothetical protein